jgi:hypothetical protein
VLASLAAVVASGASLLMPAPVVGLATEGQWTGIAVGSSPYDCDRVSIWSIKVFRLGRRTSCTAPGHRIAAVSEIDNRAVWLHVSGDATRTWTLRTATTTSRDPKLIVRARSNPGEPPPIVLGPGNMDRSQGTYGEGDALPYAVGRQVTVLNSRGKRTFRWTAPSRVVGFATDAGVLVVAVADGTLFVFAYTYDPAPGWKLDSSYPGPVAATRIAYDGVDVVVQRGRKLEAIHLDKYADCELQQTLAPGEQLAGDGGGTLVLAGRGRYRIVPGCRGPAYASGTANVISVDRSHFSTAVGRRVTSDYVPGA